MTADTILTLITHGGPAAITGLLWYLFVRERNERQEAQAAVLALTREITASTAQMVRVTEDNTKATQSLAEHVRTAIAEKLDHLVRRRGGAP